MDSTYPHYVNLKKLAVLLEKSTWTLRRYRIEYGMPFIKIGGRFFYDILEVQEWFTSFRQDNKTVAAKEPANNGQCQLKRTTCAPMAPIN